jgi:hypothetical protein
VRDACRVLTHHHSHCERSPGSCSSTSAVASYVSCLWGNGDRPALHGLGLSDGLDPPEGQDTRAPSHSRDVSAGSVAASAKQRTAPRVALAWGRSSRHWSRPGSGAATGCAPSGGAQHSRTAEASPRSRSASEESSAYARSGAAVRPWSRSQASRASRAISSPIDPVLTTSDPRASRVAASVSFAVRAASRRVSHRTSVGST